MTHNYPDKLRAQIKQDTTVPLIGVYDVFSAAIAARSFHGLFISGFSFAASFYGLPDIGYISWSDIAAFTQRVRTLLPEPHIVVDMDDGYGDPELACHVALLLENMGASGIVLEDQKRPRRCGHLEGKQILDLDDYLLKLQAVLSQRENLFVIARTDAVDKNEILRRVNAFCETTADAILVDGIDDLDFLRQLSSTSTKPLMFNQIFGGKSPRLSLTELKNMGIALVNYSTPCITAAQSALQAAMHGLLKQDGLLTETLAPGVDLHQCNHTLTENLNGVKAGVRSDKSLLKAPRPGDMPRSA